jgi:alpha-acetolactate decarboxylase
MATNELYQYSIMTALMEGIADHGIPLSTLLEHGTHGLGTFRHLDGEMIVLDGKVYQMRSDGSVTAISAADLENTITPFAAVTRFEPTVSKRCRLGSKADLVDVVNDMLPDDAKNHFIALRATGCFAAITTRTVGGQTYPHEPLVEVGKHQASHDFKDVRGTIVGFRSPAYMQGLSVAGDHLHFITEEKGRGGHLLALQTGSEKEDGDGEVLVEAAPIWRLHLELPKGDREFDEAKLEGDAEGIRKVEG